jgi:hypothetical protein
MFVDDVVSTVVVPEVLQGDRLHLEGNPGAAEFGALARAGYRLGHPGHLALRAEEFEGRAERGPPVEQLDEFGVLAGEGSERLHGVVQRRPPPPVTT